MDVVAGAAPLSMEQRLHRRIFSASVWSAGVATGFAVPLLLLPCGPSGWGLLSGAVALGPAHTLRAAAVVQRSVGLRPPTAHGAAVAFAAVVATAIATSLFFASLVDSPESTGIFSLLVGCVALLHLADRRVLQWSPIPREAAHRRLKAGIFCALLRALRGASLCVVAAAWVDGSSIFARAVLAKVWASVFVLLAAELHAESIQSCAVCLAAHNLPTAVELAKALAQPISTHGPGLGRWIAMSTLSQAVAHRQQGSFPGVRAGTGMSIGSDANTTAYALPPLVAEVFSCSSLPSWQTGPAMPAGHDAAVAGAPGWAQNWAFQKTPHSGVGDVGLVGVLRGNGRGGLFTVYLASALEVMREFTVRVTCLASAARGRGPDALHPAQIAALDAQVVELLSLAQAAVAGLASWICLSRDLDEAGVVQREESLRKVMFELCGVISAIETVWPLRAALSLSGDCVRALQCAREEVRHSLEQLVLTFEDVGLHQVSLPPLYRNLIASLCR